MLEGLFPKKKAASSEKEGRPDIARGPIIVCAERFGLLDFEDQRFLDTFSEHAEYVDYLGTRGNFDYYKQLGSPRSYVIATPSESDKFSRQYLNCSGVAAIGVDKDTGKNISILTHQDPSDVLPGAQFAPLFQDDLVLVCKILSRRTEPGSVDMIIFGGDHGFPEQQAILKQQKTRHDDYIDVVTLITNIAHAELNVKPIVALGPRTIGAGGVDAFLDTQHRRLYLTRKGNPDVDKDFPASEVRKHVDERLRKLYPDYYRAKEFE